ncbi:FMN-dependent alpha-hydroxy acid dehydrogenase [Eremomyces bilateralis CBS 781.70]|uniref:FMN-dependent alpha-hydroxy acid dehydrogenase n=1 Tax=Eremomyces bilateralis CBS 781.70 TaxID=1392243 RepID=A0A6G1GGF6_9PEZI|nr:FMN-dependent alpha-hydroxy acid dehydrogenase [Eremomyces bilateralis CBS 781.70]KAF1817148.1 FMN-dependent alpha-hydroxy acid dehydrogenase [Eremomyces bilateralis CBS 781.70]
MRLQLIAACFAASGLPLVAAQTAQELLNSVLNPDPGSSTYASYSTEIYYNATLYNQTTQISTSYYKLEASAKLRLPPAAYDYAAGGAGLETTVAANRAAFDNWSIVPRVMRNILPKRNLTTTLFGKSLPAPIVMAPVGVQTMFHPDGERATASVFGELGLPYTLSTASSTGFVDVAEANGDNPRWYQLYWPTDDDLTRSYLKSAKENGYDVLVVTVDTWDLGWRTRDLDRGFFPFIRGIGVQIGLEDACAHEKLGFNPLSPNATDEQKQMAALYHVISTSRGVSPIWENLPKLREFWGKGPIVLKGIQSADDAKKAVEHGVDGIIVSNHGGRQIDGAIGSLDALYGISKAVKGKITIGFDGGIRSGADIFKALAIGADFVQIGRPVLWGLAHEGAVGVRHVLKSLLAEFDLTLGLSGCKSVQELNQSFLVAR